MSQLLSQFWNFFLQNKVNSLSLCEERRDFHDPETPRCSGAPHVTSHFLALPCTRSVYCLNSGLPPSARISLGSSGYVFEDLLAREEQPSATFENSMNLAYSSRRRMRPEVTEVTKAPERDMKREQQKLVETRTKLPKRSRSL